MTRALVRPTSRRLAEGQLTHLERTPVDIDLAERQWADYCDALAAAGFQTVQVPETRRAETDAVAAAVRALGIETVALDGPATLDGGDVLKVGDTAYVGQGGRTSPEGIRQLRALLAPRGWTVVGVPVTRVLHLKSAVTALPDGTVIGHPDDVDHAALFPRFLPMPEHGAAVVVLSSDTVLMAASVPHSAALVERLGYRVVIVDIGEFEKLEGCVTCLSVRIRP